MNIFSDQGDGIAIQAIQTLIIGKAEVASGHKIAESTGIAIKRASELPKVTQRSSKAMLITVIGWLVDQHMFETIDNKVGGVSGWRRIGGPSSFEDVIWQLTKRIE